MEFSERRQEEPLLFDSFNDLFAKLAADNQERPQQSANRGDFLVALAGEGAAESPKKIDIKEDQFKKLFGDKAADALKSVGVENISISKNADGTDRFDITLKKSVKIKQDPKIDGTHEIMLGTSLSGNLKRDGSGKLVVDKVDGMEALVEGPLGGLHTAKVLKLEMSKGADGKTTVKSTGKVGFVQSSRTRTYPGEIISAADTILEKLDAMRKDSKK